MKDIGLTEQLGFVIAQRQQNETTVLAQAVCEGIQVLYRETLIEAYLMGPIPRETILNELGVEQLEEIEYQHDTLQCDVAWSQRSE